MVWRWRQPIWRQIPVWSIFDEFRTLHPLHDLCGKLSRIPGEPGVSRTEAGRAGRPAIPVGQGKSRG